MTNTDACLFVSRRVTIMNFNYGREELNLLLSKGLQGSLYHCILSFLCNLSFCHYGVQCLFLISMR